MIVDFNDVDDTRYIINTSTIRQMRVNEDGYGATEYSIDTEQSEIIVNSSTFETVADAWKQADKLQPKYKSSLRNA